MSTNAKGTQRMQRMSQHGQTRMIKQAWLSDCNNIVASRRKIIKLHQRVFSSKILFLHCITSKALENCYKPCTRKCTEWETKIYCLFYGRLNPDMPLKSLCLMNTCTTGLCELQLTRRRNVGLSADLNFASRVCMSIQGVNKILCIKKLSSASTAFVFQWWEILANLFQGTLFTRWK